jgi:nucleotide-binding universal stress UspA family protein
MLELKRVLVPIDFSETSDRALDYAIELASRFGAEVTVMHAYELPIYGFPDGALVATVDVATRISEASQQALAAAVEKRLSRGVKLTSVLRDGVPWEEINAVANEINADIIVMGTHARRGLRRALLGSVAENVIRTTPRPVLTIHGPREHEEEHTRHGKKG